MTYKTASISELQEERAVRVLDLLETDARVGLAAAEVQARLKRYGHNEVREKKANPLLSFAKKFWGPTAWMLEMIIILSWFLRKTSDLYVVIGLLVINAVLSFIQEQRASGVIETLRNKLHVEARALRDGAWGLVSAAELVPGDIVRMRAGDFVPADIKIVEGELGVDQSALTGESLEAEKGPDAVLFSGSIVRRGEANGVVLFTGTQTYYGRTTELVQIARPKLHVERVISNVVKWLFTIVSILAAVALVVAWMRGVYLLDMLPLMLVILLGGVPVSLPVMFTVSLALGSMRLAKVGVLVTRLSATDDAATMDVLCVDKTGTITTNQLAVTGVIPLNGSSEREVLQYGALASQEANHDPIDVAFLAAIQEQGGLDGSLAQMSFVPFDPSTRRTEATIMADGGELRVTKGAVLTIAQTCCLSPEEAEKLEQHSHELAEQGQRTLAVAVAKGEAPFQPVGLVTLSDMPRKDAPRLIKELQRLGVSVKMLTGDALPIAREIAGSIGIGSNVHRVSDLEELAHSDTLAAAVMAEETDGFAEIYPEDKFTIVKALQGRQHVVGMTGDGVNDAPALRQAEVGIAVQNATDVAKGAASVVLEGGLAGIIDLIKNGRRIHQNISTWILNKVSRTLLKSGFVVFAFLITGKFVVTAFAMMLITLMTDFVKISLATDNVRISPEPERWNIAGLVKVAVLMGVLMLIEAFALLFFGLRHFGLAQNEEALHTFSYLILFYFAIFSIFAVRERRHFWDSLPSKAMLIAMGTDLVIGTVLATVGLPSLHPLPLHVTATVFVASLVFSLIINDFVKCWMVDKVGVRR